MPGQLARFSIKESADGFLCVSQRAEESCQASSTRIPRIPLGAKTQILAEHRGSCGKSTQRDADETADPLDQ